MKKRYEVLIGIEYGGRQVPPGGIVDDVPRRSVPWLLEQGAIREVAEEEQPPGGRAADGDGGESR